MSLGLNWINRLRNAGPSKLELRPRELSTSFSLASSLNRDPLFMAPCRDLIRSTTYLSRISQDPKSGARPDKDESAPEYHGTSSTTPRAGRVFVPWLASSVIYRGKTGGLSWPFTCPGTSSLTPKAGRFLSLGLPAVSFIEIKRRRLNRPFTSPFPSSSILSSKQSPLYLSILLSLLSTS
jgi:hypothetical protein